MERRAHKVHPTEGEGSKVHKQRANLIKYAVIGAIGWTVLCVLLVASDRWQWNEGVIFTSHIAILAVFGLILLYSIWVNKNHPAYAQVVWMLLIYNIVVTIIIVLTL